jgi:hypothetical protein
MSEKRSSNQSIDSYTHAALEVLGVKVVDAEHATLQCVKCGASWPAERDTKGKLLRGVWKCPQGCNEGQQ